MMKTIRYQLLALLSFCALVVSHASAQNSHRTLSFLEVIPDARAAAMGLQPALTSQQNQIYLNPGAIFYLDGRGAVSGNLLLYPKSEEEVGRLTYKGLNGAFRLDDRHAIFAGFRHQSGLRIPLITNRFGEQEGEIKPYDLSVDIGYAVNIAGGFTAFATGSYVKSKIVESGNSARFDLGASYHTRLNWGFEPSLLSLVLKVSNIGSNISYDKNSSYPLPTNAVLGSDLHFKLDKNNAFALALGGRYFFTGDSSIAFQGSAGVEYTLQDLISARVGYRYAPNKSSRYTAGLGFHLAGFRVDVTYIAGLKSTNPDFLLGTLSYTF